MRNHKYHYCYRITNLVNGKYYYGIHSTNHLDDGYLGSGTHLCEDKRKYGKNNFKKEILKFFKTRQEASEYEKTIVNEDLIHDANCYNVKLGGDYGLTIGTTLVIDDRGIMHRCTPENERYISGEWVPFTSGKVPCVDMSTNKCVIVSVDEFHLNHYKYTTFTENTVIVKDNTGNVFRVNKNDVRYVSGELNFIWKGKHHTPQTKQKMSKTHKDNRHQQGEKNAQFGKCWITKDGINKVVPKDCINEYLSNGWMIGRNIVAVEKQFKAQNKLNKETIENKLRNKQSKKSIAMEFGVSENALRRFIHRIGLDKIISESNA